MNSDNRIVAWSLGLAFAAIVAYFVLSVVVPRMVTPPESPVTRTTSDLRTLATALETFHIDHNRYPASTTNTLETFNFRSAPPGTPSFKAFPPSTFTTKQDSGSPPPYNLTSPIAYLSAFPRDVFVTADSPYAYFTSGTCWLVWSPGPDRRYDINYTDYDYSNNTPTPDFTAKYAYDSTNGARSRGDIFRAGGNLLPYKY